MKLNSSWKSICIVIAVFSITPFQSSGQFNETAEDYYLFPIKPGTRNTLAGTMGELRSSHFHTGIDIRTGGVQGVPVLAAADGYISRIAVSSGGYGNALYILHPNGETTVYAHLKEFAPEIQEYVRREQYRRKTFEINLFPKERLKISRGDTIALSGNSGSSSGPHLHFDIRDKNQRVLNPLKYNFEEIVDYRSPQVRKVALKTMNTDSRINGQFGRFEFKVRRVGKNWVVDSAITVYGKIAVELYAFDRQDWTRFRTGINEILMKLDDDTIFHQVIDNISFSKSRHFYTHINYERILNTGERFHKLYVDDGNELDFYTTSGSKGVISFDEACDHTISIDMYDTYKNHSALTIPVICAPPGNKITNAHPDREVIDMNSYKILDNTLVVFANQQSVSPEEAGAVLYFQNSNLEVLPSYSIEDINVYLWDLRSGLPDSIDLCNSWINPGLKTTIPSGVPFKFYNHYIDATFSSQSLFDTVYLQIQYDKSFMDTSELFVFGNNSLPVKSNFEIKLKPARISPDKSRRHVYSLDDRGNFGFEGGEWTENHIIFNSSKFGSFTLLTDSLPPEVKPLIINHEKLVFRIEDELSGIKEFTMLVNEEWVLMNYEPKNQQIWSEKLDPAKPFEGEIILSVIDNAGNEKLYKTNLAKYEPANR